MGFDRGKGHVQPTLCSSSPQTVHHTVTTTALVPSTRSKALHSFRFRLGYSVGLLPQRVHDLSRVFSSIPCLVFAALLNLFSSCVIHWLIPLPTPGSLRTFFAD